jgi:2,3-dihydroxyphenylpropionate 1,2-dioxygenase
MSYQALSHHGHGVIQFLPDLPTRTAPPASSRPPRFGGHEFTFTDYEYYRFPQPETLALNRMLHRIVADPGYRAEFVANRRGVVEAAGLGERERAALLASERFDVLTALGAHPLLALSARQVSEIEQRRQSEPKAVSSATR